jgi:hypothetical protein
MLLEITQEHLDRADAAHRDFQDIRTCCPIWQAMRDGGYDNPVVGYTTATTGMRRFYIPDATLHWMQRWDKGEMVYPTTLELEEE